MNEEQGALARASGSLVEPRDSLLRHALIVLALCVPVYWVGLSQRGIADSEGHRVVPGWELLDRGWGDGAGGPGRWLVPFMFERAYVRKPPGMPWAIAGSAAVLGESEFSARAVSALASTLTALGTMLVARRWFGGGRGGAGLVAGALAALAPGLVAPGRTAEIEALNNLCVAASVWGIVELALGRGRAWAWAPIAAAAMLAMALVKGPAGAPVVACTALASCALAWRRASGRVYWVALGVALAGAGAWVLYQLAQRALARMVSGGEQPVTQGVSEFLWHGVDAGQVARVIAMPIVALVSAMPASLALVGLWIARRRGVACPPIAGALVIGCLLSLVMLAALGVGNPRYAMPSMVGLPIVAGWAWSVRPGSLRTMAWQRVERIVVAALVLACVGLGPVRDALRSPIHSGKAAGLELGARLAQSHGLATESTIWVSAGDAIEARPEVLWYLKKGAEDRGVRVRAIWGGVASIGDFVLARTDAGSGEREIGSRVNPTHGVVPVPVGEPVRASKYEFTLYRCYSLDGERGGAPAN